METSMTYIAKFSKSLTRHLLTADSDPMQLLSSHFLLCRLCSFNIDYNRLEQSPLKALSAAQIS